MAKHSRHRKAVKTVKYSSETTTVSGTLTSASEYGDQIHCAIVAPSSAQGIRKVKNFTCRLISANGQAPTQADPNPGPTIPLYFALVYVPQGTSVQTLTIGTPDGPASLYEPNQNVILSGILLGDGQTLITTKSRLARNLNSGDSIELVIRTVGPQVNKIMLMVNYAICYN